jgi:uncharacterized protein with HEPN domain
MAEFNRNVRIAAKIVFYCEKIEQAALRFGNSSESFASDFDFRSVCAMYIIQIGELATVLSEDFRQKYNGVPWRVIRGMRNVFAHDYHHLDVEETWKTIETDIPSLKAYCEKILKKERYCISEDKDT